MVRFVSGVRTRSGVLAIVVLAVVVTGGWFAFARGSAPPPKPVANRAFHGLKETGRPIVAWAVGDGAIGAPTAEAVGKLIARDDPDRVLYLGDVYETGTAAEFKAGMTRVFGPVLHRMLPTPGNHEWPNHVTGYDAYWRRLTGHATPPWYAVRIGAWQVLSLNSEAPHDAGSAQVRWLRKRLQGPSTCRIAFWHRPRYSAGTHGDQSDIAPLWNALKGRAALILNGHDHDVQRFKPIAGTIEVVDGAGGRGHYPVSSDRRLAFSDDHADAALRLTLDGTEARLRVITSRGRTLDRDTVTCSTA
jgi:acid phosphatase type 7